EVKDLSYTYPGKKAEVLKEINFKIEQGEIFGFLGPSGAGKSTTQKVITGILKNYRGEVRVAEREIAEIDNNFYEKIGVSFEFPNLYQRFTALENLEYFASLYRKETEDPFKLQKMVGLTEAVRVRVSDFSKGMKMRLNLCRAFIHNPELLFLDEPTSGLDPASARQVKDLIRAHCSTGKTVFLTTHDMKAVEDLCHRVAFIVEGKLVLIDSPQGLKREYGSKMVEVEYKKGSRRISFSLPGLGKNREFQQLLQNNELDSIHSQEADLEQVFIEVTGRRLN
ncbi:MAG TPA: ABC transporter ATP-binding protein, partial [Halanaerobiales bacterium]|nr:ABC transporter ATP-binding protein [Halanaerobiales bacterium]